MTSKCLWFQCRGCEKTQRVGVADAALRLAALGMLRRAADPESAVVFELFLGALGRLPCPDCGQAKLRPCDAPRSPDENADWPEAKACVDCGALISAARLEILPQTERCTTCQQQEDRGEGLADDEFCPRCGDRLQIKPGGSGITRYRWYCPSCRR